MASKCIGEQDHAKYIPGSRRDGNAFVLLIFTRTLGKLLGKDSAKIIAEMTAGDYEHLITVFEREFGGHVVLYR